MQRRSLPPFADLTITSISCTRMSAIWLCNWIAQPERGVAPALARRRKRG